MKLRMTPFVELDFVVPENVSVNYLPTYVQTDGVVGLPFSHSYLFSMMHVDEQPSPSILLPSSQASSNSFPSPHISVHISPLSSYPALQVQIPFTSTNFLTVLHERHAEEFLAEIHPRVFLMQVFNIILKPLLQAQESFLS